MCVSSCRGADSAQYRCCTSLIFMQTKADPAGGTDLRVQREQQSTDIICPAKRSPTGLQFRSILYLRTTYSYNYCIKLSTADFSRSLVVR